MDRLVSKSPGPLSPLHIRPFGFRFRKRLPLGLKLGKPGVVGLGGALFRVERGDLRTERVPDLYAPGQRFLIFHGEQPQILNQLRMLRIIARGLLAA